MLQVSYLVPVIVVWFLVKLFLLVDLQLIFGVQGAYSRPKDSTPTTIFRSW